ncbi:DUF255 domain-containing protein [Halospeciosus flavus]|uniref:DUF255 domain-containing protein n=1 Tax=Halospeciosus flavus TaxID=3032283 RepID=A0ABD5Z8P8_9EURY|nr:DUF255 domain-containing protein [Halospeciosus flavus]
MDESARQTKVNWREWGPATFEEADAADMPLLLSLSAPWCGWCRRMDEGAYSEPRVAANVNEDFVPVRVDADRLPRVRERYNMGGFPSTVFLTPEGKLLSGATYLEPDGFRQVLERVREAYDEKGRDAGRVPRALRGEKPPAGEVTADIERLVAGQLGDKYDEDHAGWGTSEKFPLPQTVEFALKRERDQALRTLDAVKRSLLDDFDGGFFRHAHERDWSDPQREKLLDENAALLRAYANAYLYTGEGAYRHPAQRAIDYLTGTLWTGEAFGGSQEPGDYYALPPESRTEENEPDVDATAFADRNARAADALLTYAAYTDDETAARYAERTLDFLETELVDDGRVAHYGEDDAPTGLLADHAWVVRAFATAAQVVDPVYAETARHVADDAVDRLATESGALVDGPEEGPGLLDRPLYPVDDNATFANALVDLAVLTGDDAYETVAHDAVAAFAGAADRMGVQVAPYATAASRLVGGPLTIEVGDDAGSDLHRAALRMADHEKVVVPDADVAAGTARVNGGEPVETPEALAEAVSEAVAEE